MTLNTFAPLAEAPLPDTPGTRRRRWVPIRTLSEKHRPQVCAHLLALDPEARQLRFGHAATDEGLAHYAERLDFQRDQVFGSFDRRLRLVTLGHLALDPARGTGEFAVSVLARQRGRGLGTQLFEHAVTHARNRGVRTLFVHLARENAPMLAIVQRAGALIDFDGSDARAQLTLPADTLGTKFGELLERHAAELDFRAKAHALRTNAAAVAGPARG